MQQKRPKAREIAPKPGRYTENPLRCEADVGYETIKFRAREVRHNGKEFNPQCRNIARYSINGKILCTTHAGKYALKLLLPLPDVCEDCGRNTKAPLFDGCMFSDCPRGYKPCL